MRLLRFSLLSFLVVLTFGAAKRRTVSAPTPAQLLPERSFAITDKPILDGFPFDRVLGALIARSNARGVTPESLFRQWMDTQNPKPGLDAAMPHCNDELVDGSPAINGFRRRCPTPEGAFATAPFDVDDFFAIAITNRFDLADPAGSHCGQFRITFARKMPAAEVFHIIFEGALPNPNPSTGLAGCRPVAQFWADLSAVDSPAERRARLEQFFFNGIDGFAPLLHPDHYRVAPAGIRTLQGTGPALPRFYQFRVINDDERLYLKPDVLENLPFGRLFNATVDTPQAMRFREAFLENVSRLAVRDVNLYSMNIPDEFLLGESDAGGQGEPFVYDVPYSAALSTPGGQQFNSRIVAELQKTGSTLTPAQIITRAETQNCVGCHFLGADVGEGVIFPTAAGGLQHVTEDRMNGTRYVISQAMSDVFIPHRMKILTDFLRSGTPPVHSN